MDKRSINHSDRELNTLEKVRVIFSLLDKKQYSLHSEKFVQTEIYNILRDHSSFSVKREYRLSNKHIIDFIIDDGIGVEVKVKGSAVSILKQCESYCGYDDIHTLILITSKSMGFPCSIKTKPCYYFSLSRAML